MPNNKQEELLQLLKYKKENIISNELEIEKIKNLEYLLKDNNLFFKIDFDTAIGILDFLGIGEDKIVDYYFQLISPENLKENDTSYITVSNCK